MLFFFFKQKTAYEMRISDWSSDGCSSDLIPVKTIARPASSAAAITSSSRTEPPGWITAVAPASTAASRPSANGKKASDATAEPTVRGASQPFGRSEEHTSELQSLMRNSDAVFFVKKKNNTSPTHILS